MHANISGRGGGANSVSQATRMQWQNATNAHVVAPVIVYLRSHWAHFGVFCMQLLLCLGCRGSAEITLG